jgi:hypothetical protein
MTESIAGKPLGWFIHQNYTGTYDVHYLSTERTKNEKKYPTSLSGIHFRNGVILFIYCEVHRFAVLLSVFQAGEEGLEPPTDYLEGSCSIQLSYSPVLAPYYNTLY